MIMISIIVLQNSPHGVAQAAMAVEIKSHRTGSLGSNLGLPFPVEGYLMDM